MGGGVGSVGGPFQVRGVSNPAEHSKTRAFAFCERFLPANNSKTHCPAIQLFLNVICVIIRLSG